MNIMPQEADEIIKFELDLNQKPDYLSKVYQIYRLGEFKAAAEFITKFLNKYPDDLEGKCLLALCTLRYAKTDNVEAPLLAFMQQPKKINITDAIFALMQYYNAQGNEEKAQYYADKYLEETKFSVASAFNNQSNIQQSTGFYEEAVQSHIKAINAMPNINSYNALISLLRFSMRYQEALVWAEKGLKDFPDCPAILIEYAIILRYICDWRGEYIMNHQLLEEAWTAIKENKLPAIAPFYAIITLEDSKINYEIAKKYARYKQKITPPLTTPFTYPRKKKNKIKIGYISMSFRDHPVGRMTVDMYRYHDRDKFEIHCYSNWIQTGDVYEAIIKENCDSFNNVGLLPSMEIAKKIHADEIDILIDLDAYLAHNRMEVLTYKPAPIQINYLGYPGTTGGNFMDYIIADEIIIPSEQQEFYSEKVLYMPKCYQMYSDYTGHEIPIVTRESEGLPQDKFIFTCFNMPHKIDERSFNSWMKILHATDNSVLWLFTLDEQQLLRDNLYQHARENNVDPARIIFGKFAPKYLHLARIKLADLMLDSFICNAHSTATDALWSHLPVLTLQGKHFSSRVCSSLLNYVGLNDLITYTEAEYEAKAIELAKHPEYLKKYQAILQNNVMKTLCNTALTVQNLEKGYQKVWQNYLDGKEPCALWI